MTTTKNMSKTLGVTEANVDMDIDDVEFKAQGYDRAMPRRFSTLSLMSLSYALLATWNGFGSVGLP